MSHTGVISKWPKIFIVSALSNAGILALYYSPSLSGLPYYLIGTLKTVPLIMLLVYLAQKDPSPNWTYRAMCWVFILQILTSGWHILAGLSSPYYDQLSLFATVAELLIITLGGLDVRFSYTRGRADLSRRAMDCSTWARRHHKS
jgi:hypothetical protein